MPHIAQTAYDPVAKSFHWLIVLSILSMFTLAALMDMDFAQEQTRRLIYTSHKTLGFLILIATFLRLGWRLRHTPPALPVAMPLWERAAAHTTHFALYLLCFLIPLAGWALVSAGPYGLQLFGTIPVPSLPVGSWTDILPDPRAFFAGAHGFLASALLFVLAAHIAAALKHHFIDKDDVLRRMLPGRMKSL